MSPRTPLILVALAGAGVLLGACGAPPQQLPSSPPYPTPSAGAISIGPPDRVGLPTALPTGLPTDLPLPTGLTPYPTGPAYPTGGPAYPYPTGGSTTRPTTTPPPGTVSPTARPSPAPSCSAQPTRPQILALIKGQEGVPDRPMRVFEGPFCSGQWSLATVEVTGADADDLEPLMVVATGTGATLTLVAAGSDVCISRVETAAPKGIRVLACGY
ncbi:hypothetical protein [Paractinoplanes abujensis]|uniref:Uncharacterized protein n=1 Tax=Paractinoplanes abujensis TaxID=882441 RepID=A0A7W7CX93_9ACTN|nr:hypothetical protein [Actinoplanes abujensis]MBB4696169.1 hypothetical protein [Actinoplanes abujensis]